MEKILPLENLKSFQNRLIGWFRKHQRDLPWRRTRDPYAILVSEIMLQQTQVATVVDYYERWMRRFPDVQTLAATSEADVLQMWQGLGYYSRARNLRRAAMAVSEQFDGKFPRDLESIRALPGVGRYTAGAVATFAFNAPTPIIDANIARVLSRLADFREPIDSTTGQRALWEFAAPLVPQKNARDFNSALMELGALVCSPRQPQCGSCAVREFCRAENPEKLPIKKPRPKTLALREECAFVVSENQILLEQQTGRRWHGMWRLPLTEHLATPIKSRVRETNEVIQNSKIVNSSLLLTLEYPFTHHRVTLAVFHRDAPKNVSKDLANDHLRWFAVSGLDDVAMTAPHRRAALQLLFAEIIPLTKKHDDSK